MTTLLVLTVGQSDVQIVDGNVRRELMRERCALLHDEIEERVGGWRLVDSPENKAGVIEFLPDREFLLCTPKLDAVLGYLAASGTTSTTALVLETRRDADAERGDPRFAGAILEERLRGQGAHVQRHAYLTGTERLEDRESPRDKVIRREIVQRLEQAVRECLTTVKPSHVVVAATGGFPIVGSLVEEIVQLYALSPAHVKMIEVPDGAKSSPPTADRALVRSSVPEPLVSYQTRRRALELVERGDLLGAWAVAQPLHGDEVEREWTQVIESLALFASSLPMPEGCDIPVITSRRMAVRAALRVELALRARDIPRAVHGTVAFSEAALMDYLLDRFQQDHDDSRLFMIRDGTTAPTGKLLRDGQGCDGKEDDRNRPFELKETRAGVNLYRFHQDGAGRFARDFVQSENLKNLVDAVGKVKKLRNDVAHNEPTPELMQDARRCMIEAQLWSEDDRFLVQPLTRNVLSELEVSKPAALCSGLIAEVRRRVLR